MQLPQVSREARRGSIAGTQFVSPGTDDSALTRIRERLPLFVHERVFACVLEITQQKKLLSGTQVGKRNRTPHLTGPAISAWLLRFIPLNHRAQ